MQGIWSGMLGGTVMQTIILIWITARTDWNKEVIQISLLFLMLVVILVEIDIILSNVLFGNMLSTFPR